MDQTMARNDAVAREVGKLIGTEPMKQPQLRAQALMMAIGEAAERLQPKPCPHFDYSVPPFEQDIHIHLSFGTAACHDCLGEFIEAHVAKHGLTPVSGPDDRCDLCDAPSTDFREIGTQWGVARVSMNVCDECYDWLNPTDYIQRFPSQ
jgi:hypothetical protein